MVLWKNCHTLEQFSTVQYSLERLLCGKQNFFYSALSNFQFFNGFNVNVTQKN